MSDNTPIPNPEPKKKSPFKAFAAVAVVILLIAVGGAGFYFGRQGSNDYIPTHVAIEPTTTNNAPIYTPTESPAVQSIPESAFDYDALQRAYEALRVEYTRLQLYFDDLGLEHARLQTEFETSALAQFMDIQTIVNGFQTPMVDADGNVLESVLLFNRVYVPMEGIANALDKQFHWNDSAARAYIGARNYTWLDQMGFINYRASGAANSFIAWPTERNATDGTIVDRGVLFSLSNWMRSGSNVGAIRNDSNVWVSYHSLDFMLNSRYDTLRGTLVSVESERIEHDNQQGAQIRMYGDGRLIYASPSISSGTISVDFIVDVTGVEFLSVYVDIPSIRVTDGGLGGIRSHEEFTYVGIVNARFERN